MVATDYDELMGETSVQVSQRLEARSGTHDRIARLLTERRKKGIE